MAPNYHHLLDKINEFTRKFYLNKVLRGGIYAGALVFTTYLCLFLFVYYNYPSIAVKTTLFYTFLVLAIVAISFWVVVPLLSYLKITKSLSNEEAAKLIGMHYNGVSDRILNTIQLQSLAEQSPNTNALIIAGINQKIEELSPIPFANAINLGQNKKYLKYVVAPLFIIALIAIVAPAILKEGTSNFVAYQKEILKPAPFAFIIQNKTLNVTQGDDFTLQVALKGDQFPKDLYFTEGANTYKLERIDLSHFTYAFNDLQESKKIRLSGGGFSSKTHLIRVNAKPQLAKVAVKLVYPAYLQKKATDLTNPGDMVLPFGTTVNFTISTQHANNIIFALNGKKQTLAVSNDIAVFSTKITAEGTYQILPKNEFSTNNNAIINQIKVIADQYPQIEVTEIKDSLSTKALYFQGLINDDYGFSSLKFIQEITENNRTVKRITQNIGIKKSLLAQPYFYYWNIKDLDLKPNQLLKYYFEVSDNDEVNGAKTTKSDVKFYKAPTTQEIAEKIAAGSESLKGKIEATMKLATAIEKETKKLNEQILDKKQIDLEDKKQIDQLLSKQKQLEDAIKDIKAQNEKNNFNKEENGALADEIKEKQQKIDELFNKVLDDKTKDLLNKLQQLMDQNNKNATRNELSKMQLDNKTVKNELDRILELYKQLEFEQGLQNKIDRLNDLAKQQNELAKQSADKKTPANAIKQEQEHLQKEFQQVKKELADLKEKNDALERPNDFKSPESEAAQAEKLQQESSEELKKNNKQEAAKKQEQAAAEMQKMANQLKSQQQNSQEKEQKVNAKALRKLLENLLNTSFEQENLIKSFRNISATDPQYVQLVKSQNGVKDNMKIIADSLTALSKRVPEIESAVTTEIDKINFNVGKTLEFLGDRRTSEANRTQQFTMTAVNNLALMLNEALEQMQNAAKSGKGAGGKGKQGLSQLQQMQEQLNKNMQQARDKMQQQGGNMGTVPKGQMSEQFAKMAQQQQLIREALEKINNKDNKGGNDPLGNLNQTIKEMKQSELDLVNKRITQETINRQKKLLTKLLEAQNAERQQDEDSKRESQAAKQFPPSYQKLLEQYNKSFKTEQETIQRMPPGLNYYYKNKVTEYFKLLNLQQK